MATPGEQAGDGGGEDADQHGGAHAPGQQGGDQQESEKRERGALIGQVAQGDGGGGMGHDDARIAEADEGDEEAHAGGHGRVEFVRDGGEDQLAHAQQREHQKRDAGEKDRAERGLPGHSHAFDHGVGEVGIEAHAGSQRDRVAGESAHQETAHRGGEAGGGGHGGQRHARLMEDRRVDEDDIRHRHERGESGQDFGLPIGAKRLEFEVSLQRETQGHHAILTAARDV